MKTSTNVNPLILNFMEPVISKKAPSGTLSYDSKNQITMYMGGGGGSNSPTRSYDGHKWTRRERDGSGGGNDAPRWTDD